MAETERTSRKTKAAAVPRIVPVAVAPPPEVSSEEEIARIFSNFRESAVRLVERVNDMTGQTNDPMANMHNDLKLLRSIFGKWSADALLALHAVPSIGFEELRRSLPKISPRVLSLKLKELEANGMVQRKIIDTRPPRVRYSLTEKGWTVTWLAQPIFVFLRLGEPPQEWSTDSKPSPPSVP